MKKFSVKKWAQNTLMNFLWVLMYVVVWSLGDWNETLMRVSFSLVVACALGACQTIFEHE